MARARVVVRALLRGCGALLGLGVIGLAIWCARPPERAMRPMVRLPVPAYLLAWPPHSSGKPALEVCAYSERRSATREPLERAMEELLAYPMKPPFWMWEVKGRTCTAVPPGTRLRALRVEKGLITVDLNRRGGDVGAVQQYYQTNYSGAPELAGQWPQIYVAQIVYTATGLDKDASVRILVEGKTPTSFGLSVDLSHPVHRKDVSGWVDIVGPEKGGIR